MYKNDKKQKQKPQKGKGTATVTLDHLMQISNIVKNEM